ncbi:putative heat shock protein hslv [Toxoplasma gondii GAB2-2007-GAL-DOM2]|uniref:Putative heat shock protein hslv n=11 Tax=Toxoplasma gondii TaxID=5811 RepID=S7WJH0_TOXGG|nr:putative heat shock protein hslv [Toxoplasma gondii GT1]KAF4642137.1 putative heat shock protein hslv [Toxoplasma gondii]KFG43276.1 putative heat shock protein hslv [Toxoplasma gondii GAB2-2007-GAL-DOM2]KFG51853.1 putative heat shock protein hslv [Toxoplasma gondii p89]KFH11796.1 putative heat shock protein hslv [Toxoplasma gondii VAND]
MAVCAAFRRFRLEGPLCSSAFPGRSRGATWMLSFACCSKRNYSASPQTPSSFQNGRAVCNRAVVGDSSSSSSARRFFSASAKFPFAAPSLSQSPSRFSGTRRLYTYGAPAAGGVGHCAGFDRSSFTASPFVPPRHATTILCVRKGDQVCVAGDGMVSQGQMIVKPNARKVRRLQDGVVCGFAGATADCFTLLEKLEAKLEEYPGQLLRSCVELAKQWRTDRYLRHLEAVLIVADKKMSLEVSGVGDVLESHDGILGVGSGGPYAVAAARALYDIDGLSAHEICKRSMAIAASMCCHTNDRVIFEVLENEAKPMETPQSSPVSTDVRQISDSSSAQTSP